jgi:Protein of unknown function (DUF2924)
MTPLEAEVTAAARSFESMTLEALRAEWRRRYGAPPKLRSVDLLRHLLAWRVQAQALGGLEARLVREIRAAGKARRPRRPVIDPGTRLAREWQGQLHEVEVGERGYLHQGRAYKSLSAVARAITGTRWNGPRFFGLRAEGDAA